MMDHMIRRRTFMSNLSRYFSKTNIEQMSRKEIIYSLVTLKGVKPPAFNETIREYPEEED